MRVHDPEHIIIVNSPPTTSRRVIKKWHVIPLSVDTQSILDGIMNIRIV